MKKVLGGIVFFTAVFLFSFINSFPMENIVNNVLSKEGKRAGVVVDYDTGTFSLTKVELENVTIIKQGSVLTKLDKVTANIGIGKVNLECEKEKGILKAEVESDKAKLDFKDFYIVTEGTKYFKQIAITGDMVVQTKKKISTGKLRVNLKEAVQMPMPVSDMVAIIDLKTNQDGIDIDVVDLQGTDIRGNGKINIENNRKDFNSSKINGSLKVRAITGQVTVDVSGTIGNIQVNLKPEMK
ncbi:MAG: hypothetical protein LWY06_16545 [Firmicutes bacterium]|nr:hypothetical protein [Bacillota bacterium]